MGSHAQAGAELRLSSQTLKSLFQYIYIIFSQSDTQAQVSKSHTSKFSKDKRGLPLLSSKYGQALAVMSRLCDMSLHLLEMALSLTRNFRASPQDQYFSYRPSLSPSLPISQPPCFLLSPSFHYPDIISSLGAGIHSPFYPVLFLRRRSFRSRHLYSV